MPRKRKTTRRVRHGDAELKMYLTKHTIIFYPRDDPPSWDELEAGWIRMRDELGKDCPGHEMFGTEAGKQKWRHGYDAEILRSYGLVRPAKSVQRGAA